MNKLNPIQKSLIAIILASLTLMVLIPLMFFTTLVFSNDVESLDFPKTFLPKINETVKVEPTDDGQFEIYYPKNGEWTSMITSDDPKTLQEFFAKNFSITVPGDELVSDFSQTLTDGTMEFTYHKNLLYNFKVFFDMVSGAGDALVNSIEVSVVTIIISLIIGSMAGYAMARYKFLMKDQINVGLLIVRMFPMVGISLPMAVIMIHLHLYDTILGLAILYAVPNISLTAWITSSVFLGIERDLEEASYVFGASPLKTFLKITLPMALPALAASSMYAFLTAWNDTISALILTQHNQTLALVVYEAVGASATGIQYAAAGSVILILPALVFTFIIRKYVGQMWGNASI